MRVHLPGYCEDIAQRQKKAGRAALPAAEREELSRLYDRVSVEGPTEEEEILALLTRPFSRRLAIPEYYQYTSLHVYDWFLSHYREDLLRGSIVALHTTLVDLLSVEEQEARSDEAPPAYLHERIRGLRGLLGQLDEIAVDRNGPVFVADVLKDSKKDATEQWRAFVLARCTGFRRSTAHDEYIFLRSVHACEVVFFLVRWLALRVTERIEAERKEAVFLLGQLTAFADLLNRIFDVLKTMSPERFMSFRAQTGAASAVQSLNHHAMEIAIFGFDPKRASVFDGFEHLKRLNEPLFREHESLRSVIAAAADGELAEGFAKLDRCLLRWRGGHYGFARKYLPADIKGSGGTEGAPYLKRFIKKDDCLSGGQSPGVDGELARFYFR
nr:tryptophan 2,3-dioxygenase [Archangium gephyra]